MSIPHERATVAYVRQQVTNGLGCNAYGRLEHIAYLLDNGRQDAVRSELLALLKFFPPIKKDKTNG